MLIFSKLRQVGIILNKKRKSLRVAIIDDGINIGVYKSIDAVTESYVVTDDLEIISTPMGNESSHGTVCAAIIKKYSKNIDLISIKILDKGKGETEKLAIALKFCIDKGITLINFSLGTIHFWGFDKIIPIIKEAKKNDIIMVCACNNRNTYTVPACLDEVIAVKQSDKLMDDEFCEYPYDYMGIDLEASGKYPLKKVDGSIEISTQSNSYATAYMTGIVSAVMVNTKDITKADIMKKLKKHNGFIENDIKKIYFPDEKKEVEIPVIAIIGHNISYINKILKELRYLFRKDGYYAVTVAEKYDIDIDETLNSDYSLNKNIAYIGTKYNNDIILLGGTSYDKASFITDIEVRFDNNGNISTILCDNKDPISPKNKKLSIQELYKYLVSILASNVCDDGE